jgi:hypothetical protein
MRWSHNNDALILPAPAQEPAFEGSAAVAQVPPKTARRDTYAQVHRMSWPV